MRISLLFSGECLSRIFKKIFKNCSKSVFQIFSWFYVFLKQLFFPLLCLLEYINLRSFAYLFFLTWHWSHSNKVKLSYDTIKSSSLLPMIYRWLETLFYWYSKNSVETTFTSNIIFYKKLFKLVVNEFLWNSFWWNIFLDRLQYTEFFRVSINIERERSIYQ